MSILYNLLGPSQRAVVYSEPITKDEANCTGIYRSTDFIDGLMHSVKNKKNEFFQNLQEVFLETCLERANQKFMGVRDLATNKIEYQTY